jgi:hypothetical protein
MEDDVTRITTTTSPRWPIRLLAPLAAFAAPALVADHGPGTSGGGSATQSGETMKPGSFSTALRWNFTQFEALSAARIRELGLKLEGDHAHFDALRTSLITSLEVAYGVAENFQLSLATGWYRGEDLREAHIHGDGSFGFHDLGDVTGMTDLWVTGKHRFLRGPYGSWAAYGGLKFPTGDDQERGREETEPLDPSLQPGSGAFDFLIGAAHSIFLTPRFTLDTSAQYIRRTENNDFKIGDRVDAGTALAFHFMAEPEVFPRVSLFGEANVRYLFRNEEDGEPERNSGGTVLFLSPGVRAGFTKHVSFTVAVRFPVVQALRQPQQDTLFQVASEVEFSF